MANENGGGSQKVVYAMVPLKEDEEYPRWEIIHDGCFTVGKRGAKGNKHLNDPSYHGTIEDCLRNLSKRIFHDKMAKKKSEEYGFTIEELLEEIEDHNEYMKDLFAGVAI